LATGSWSRDVVQTRRLRSLALRNRGTKSKSRGRGGLSQISDPSRKWYPETVTQVSLRKVSDANRTDCLALRVAAAQSDFVAPNTESLEDAAANPNFVALAIYAVKDQDAGKPEGPMVGFTMYEVSARVGFIRRLMIAERFQGKGYGRAAMLEVIRRLKAHPEVEIVATRHRRENEAAANLYRGLGFEDWKTSRSQDYPDEIYFYLPTS
jgi:diamine N-acetyltransferase